MCKIYQYFLILLILIFIGIYNEARADESPYFFDDDYVIMSKDLILRIDNVENKKKNKILGKKMFRIQIAIHHQLSTYYKNLLVYSVVFKFIYIYIL